MIHDPKYPYRIRQEVYKDEHWKWCCDKIEIGTWKTSFPFTGNRCTFHFTHEEDSTAFKLMFGGGEAIA